MRTLNCVCGNQPIFEHERTEYGKADLIRIGCKKCDQWFEVERKDWGIDNNRWIYYDAYDNDVNSLVITWNNWVRSELGVKEEVEKKDDIKRITRIVNGICISIATFVFLLLLLC